MPKMFSPSKMFFKKIFYPWQFKNQYSKKWLKSEKVGLPRFQTKKEIFVLVKVIREKSRGEGSLIEQDTIENVSEPNFFFLSF